jgi:hypothetical protein
VYQRRISRDGVEKVQIGKKELEEKQWILRWKISCSTGLDNKLKNLESFLILFLLNKWQESILINLSSKPARDGWINSSREILIR